MIKSFNGITSFFLAIGLLASNMYSLRLLGKRETGLPSISSIPQTPYSSFSMKKDKLADGSESFTLSHRSHDPKTMLISTSTIKPGLKGKMETYDRKEVVAQFLTSEPKISEILSAEERNCIEKSAQGASNGEMVGTIAGVKTAPYIVSQIPLLGPLVSGLIMGQSQRYGKQLGSQIAQDWHNC